MRSLLIVPPGDAAAFAAALASGADAMIADAAEARAALPETAPAFYARIPSLDAPGSAAAIAQAAAMRPRGIALHGAAGGADAQRLGARLAVEEARLGLAEGSLRIVVFATETPQAIFGLSSYRGVSARLEALIWTQEALRVALRGAPGRRDAGPFRLARDLALCAARAAGVLALDAPFLGDDAAALRAEAGEAAADGFDGKAATSAAQIAAIQEIFTRAD